VNDIEQKKNNLFFNKSIFKEWYLKKGFILIDIFIIIALIQFFLFDGSFAAMKIWLKEILGIN
tara:strand:+ start:379 stop:567 length:189 start_codon:yes stop_codon:yes gene_type:complete